MMTAKYGVQRLSYYMSNIYPKVIKINYQNIVDIFLIANGQIMSQKINSSIYIFLL